MTKHYKDLVVVPLSVNGYWINYGLYPATVKEAKKCAVNLIKKEKYKNTGLHKVEIRDMNSRDKVMNSRDKVIYEYFVK